MYQASVVLPVAKATRSGMNVTEQLPYATIRTSETEERVMIHHDCLSLYGNGHLLRDVFKAGHKVLIGIPHIVVAHNKDNLPVQPWNNGPPFGIASETEIPQMEYYAVFGNCFVPVPDKSFVHFFDRCKRTVVEPNYLFVKEMGVACEE